MRGIALAALVGWSALQLGGVEGIDLYPVLIGLALLFLLSLADGLRVQWWGFLLLLPLAPMAVNGSYPFDLLRYVALWLTVVLGAHQMRKDWAAGSRLSPMLIMLLGIGVLEALLGLAQSLGRFAGQAIPFAPMGTIYNRNHFAGFLEMLVPLAMMIGFGKLCTRTADRAAKAWIFMLAGALLFLAILFSLSRGGAIAAMVGAVVAGVLFYARGSAGGRTHARVLASGLAILVVTGALWIGIQPVVERFVKAPDDSEGRTLIWQGTMRIIQDNPLLGVGAGMHGWAFTLYQNRHPDTFFDFAHNDYLQAAAEWGVPAALLFFGVVIFLTCRAAIACVRSEDPVRAGLLAGGVGGILALLIHSFVDFNLHIPSNAMLFGLILGVAYAVSSMVEIEIQPRI